MAYVITTIGINRPNKKNCVNHETAKQLQAAFKAFEEDPESSCAVLYGKGGTFCAGYDLSEVATGNDEMIRSQNFDPFNKEGLGPMVNKYKTCVSVGCNQDYEFVFLKGSFEEVF